MGAAEAFGGLGQHICGGGFGIGEHVGIPQADDAPALRFQMADAPTVMGGLGMMLRAVQLDAEPGGAAGEVEDVRLDVELPGEARR